MYPYRIQFLNEKQQNLSAVFVDAYIKEIEEWFKDIRDDFDALWSGVESDSVYSSIAKEIFTYKSLQRKKDLANYPVGFCYPITQFCFKILNQKLHENPQHIVQRYLEEGGVLKIIWGDLRREYFQTAIQLGDWYIDVAYDAIDRSKPKIRCARFHESDFRDITSFQQYISIKEPYHKGIMYVNNILPELFPHFPFIFVNSEGRISIDESEYFGALLEDEGVSVLEDYLLDDSTVKFLDPVQKEKIKSALLKIGAAYPHIFFLKYRESEVSTLLAKIENEKFFEMPAVLPKVVNNINFILSLH
ncbi:MAG: hypothetical protein ACO3E1_09885 [Flavobacteriales bacterium]